MKEPIYHKGNYGNKVQIYSGLGHLKYVPRPMCNTKANPFSKKKNYTMVRNWKQVTCKLCLKYKKEE